jgi:hypothetical protein
LAARVHFHPPHWPQGFNFVVLVVSLFAFEPMKRRRIIDAVNATFEAERERSTEATTAEVAVGLKNNAQLLV